MTSDSRTTQAPTGHCGGEHVYLAGFAILFGPRYFGIWILIGVWLVLSKLFIKCVRTDVEPGLARRIMVLGVLGAPTLFEFGYFFQSGYAGRVLPGIMHAVALVSVSLLYRRRFLLKLGSLVSYRLFDAALCFALAMGQLQDFREDYQGGAGIFVVTMDHGLVETVANPISGEQGRHILIASIVFAALCGVLLRDEARRAAAVWVGAVVLGAIYLTVRARTGGVAVPDLTLFVLLWLTRPPVAED